MDTYDHVEAWVFGGRTADSLQKADKFFVNRAELEDLVWRITNEEDQERARLALLAIVDGNGFGG